MDVNTKKNVLLRFQLSLNGNLNLNVMETFSEMHVKTTEKQQPRLKVRIMILKDLLGMA